MSESDCVYEYVIAPNNVEGAQNSGISGMHMGGFGEIDTVVVTDINGTIVPGITECETVECAEAKIDQLYAGLNPQVDALPNLGSNIMLIMGVLGAIAIPGSFIVMGMLVRSGNWMDGFYYLIVMFFVGLAFVTAWLFG
jgi:hypothetical protein